MRYLCLMVLLAVVALPLPDSRAEVVLDGTMGRPGGLSGPDFMITGDLGTQAGGNLFHSFSSFNVLPGESATFSGPGSIQNIIARVTGGNESTIYGLLRSSIPGADLYFINPTGIFFGQGATLDIQGSFYVSTADYLRLGSDGRFDASEPGKSILTSTPPSAFGFLSQDPSSIYVNNARLDAAGGKTLSIIGGDLLLDNAVLFGPEARINIVNAASSGEVIMGAPDWNAGSFPKLGTSLMYGGFIVTSGGEESGIFIRGDGFYSRDAYIEAGSGSGPKGGMIDIRLNDALVLDGGLFRTITEGSGQGGELRIRSGGIFLSGGVSAGTTTLGSGSSGDVNVSAAEVIEISGSDQDGFSTALFSFAGSAATGATGRISVSAPMLHLSDKGLISNSRGSMGQRGEIHLSADRIRLETDSRISGGTMLLEVGTLEISSGAYIWSRAQGPDDVRTITVKARDSILITGEGQNEAAWRNKTSPLYTGIHTDVFVNADGNAGDISISSPLLRLTDSAQIGARTYTDGRGGNITVDADKLELLSGGQIAADSFGSSIYDGPAGSVTIRAKDSILISGRSGEVFSGISSSTRSGADAGSLFVQTPLLVMEDNSSILVATGVFGEGSAGEITLDVGKVSISSGAGISSSSAGYGEEGSVNITAAESVLLDNGFIVSFGSSSGKAGHISINSPLVSLSNASSISAIAYEDLDAGDISIDTTRLLLGSGSVITSESRGFGRAGLIDINAKDRVEVSGSSITTAAEISTGGNIRINTGDLILTEGSRISAAVGGGSGDGGNLSIGANALVVIEASDIIAKADQGFGGNIAIKAEAVIFSKDSEANASSNITGKDGTVEIKSPDLDISGFLAVLSSNYLNADLLLPKSCGERDEKASSFIITGRGMLPPPPDGFRVGQ